MKSIKFLADMNISPLTVSRLKQQGWDIIRINDILPATTSDVDILSFASQENYVIITQDLDFSKLVALQGHIKPSLITLRLSSANPDFVAQKLLEVIFHIREQLLEGFAVTVDEQTVRSRKLPI